MSDQYDQLAYKLRKPLAAYFLPLHHMPAGTYTPTMLGSGTPGSTTYTTQYGIYNRIGRLVFVTGTVVWTAATGTGVALFSLPFAIVNTTNHNQSGAVRITTVTFANGTPQVLMQPSTSYFTLTSPVTNAASANVDVEAAGSVVFSVWYFLE